MLNHQQNLEILSFNRFYLIFWMTFDELRNGLRQNNCPSILDFVDPFEPIKDKSILMK